MSKRKRTVQEELQSTGKKSPSSLHHNLLEWLQKQGTTGLSTLEFRPSKKVGGGIGTFTTQDIQPGSSIARLPQTCVLTATKALRSTFGQACSAAIENDSTGTDEFILLLWMAIGRKDSTHPFHPYLASLPQLPSLPISWSITLTNTSTTLENTNLGAALESHRTLIHTTYRNLVDVVQAKCPTLIPAAYNHNDLAWAHDNYLSRRFPKRLAIEPTMVQVVREKEKKKEKEKEKKKNGNKRNRISNSSSPCSNLDLNQNIVASTCSSLHGELGVMLPLFDLLNHSYETDIDWSGTALGVSFNCGIQSNGIQAGKEVFNNYGNKSNEELMMSHGFAMSNNLHDSYGLQLSVRMQPETETETETSSSSSSTTSISSTSSTTLSTPTSTFLVGTFRLYRSNNPDVESGHIEQIPSELWRAVSDPMAYMQQKLEQKSETITKDADNDDDNANIKNAIQVEWEDVNLLLQTVRARIQPFLQTKEDDLKQASATIFNENPRAQFVSMYRDGQRQILEDIIDKLKTMIGE